MEVSVMAAAYASGSQSQTNQMISTSMVKAAHASEMAMADMVKQSTETSKAQQAPPAEGMGTHVDKMA